MSQGRLRVAFVTTHPIQYHAAWFRALASEPTLDFEVLYGHQPAPADQGIGFGVPFQWDTPLLDGYRHRFLNNVAAHPALGAFGGVDTPELRTLITRDRYDAVVVNGWHYKSLVQAIRACWKSGVPVLVRSDSHLKTARHPVKQLLKSAPYRWFISRLDGCLPVGQWSADYFRHFGARQNRVFTVPHVVDPMFARESDRLVPQREQLRRAWQLDAAQVTFLFAGKFTGKKRPADFVRAVARAHASNTHVAGLMVGDGPLRTDCESLSSRLHAPVRFTGFMNQSEIVKAFVASDALVLPSDGGETWGLVVNEAMSCGRPALVSDHVGCGPDLIVNARTGFTFKLGDIEDTAARMLMCASEPRRLAWMGAQSRARIGDYSVSHAVQRLRSAVQGVLRAA